jgi:hypothetical protein
MSLKFNQGIFKLKNPQKYVGLKDPTYRSGWELTFMNFCDTTESVTKWSSEPFRIPYTCPLTGKNTVYVPDFLITYLDRNKKEQIELVEIKPANQTFIEHVGKSKYNQAQFVKNQAKWQAAKVWCSSRGIKFRILSESDIYHNPGKKR